jgi:uracil-DNA glycosylase family 4
MIPDYLGCLKCPLKDCPPVYGTGSQSPTVVIVGEAPGATEVAKKQPFVGVSGQLLRETLRVLGADLSQIYFTNSCLCRPVDNKTPTPTAVKCCSERLMGDLANLRPEKILAVGGTALSALLSPGKSSPITKYRGQGLMYKYSIDPVIGEDDIVDTAEAFMVPTYHPAAVTRDPDLFRDFAQDVGKILSRSTPFPPPEFETFIATSVDDAIDMLEALSAATILSCDLETTGFSPIHDVILSFGFGGFTPDGRGVSVIIPHVVVDVDIQFKKALKIFLGNYPGRLLFHNIKFDLQFLQVYLQEHVQPLDPWDTMLMQYAQDERGTGAESDSSSHGRGYRVHGLKDQARIRYDIPDYHFDFEEFLEDPEVAKIVDFFQGRNSLSRDELNPFTDLWVSMYKYQGMDCYVTCCLFLDLYHELEEESDKLIPLVQNHLVPAALMLTEAELTGVPVSREYLLEQAEILKLELEGMEKELREYVSQMNLEGVDNFNSPTQVKKFVWALGLVGIESTEREYLLLELQKKKNGKPIYSEEISKIIHTLVDYRQKSRTLGKDINGLIDRIDQDERIRPDYLLHGASTGRLACRDPNLQNIPVLMGPIIRKGIVSGNPQYVLMEFDESQLELRVAAWLAQDQAMIQIFEDNGDIHRKVASDMFEKPPELITKHERYLAKYVDFGVIYGRGAKSLTEGWEAQYIVDNLGGKAWTLPQAQAFIDKFMSGVPGLSAWIKKQHEFVRKNRWVETPMGRKRRFPFITQQSVSGIERQAVNTPIQSFGSDIVVAAVIRLYKKLPEGVELLPVIVHDSVMFRVRQDRINEVYYLVKKELETPPIPMNVPLKAECKVGLSWGDMEDYHPDREGE